jgi:hypothetical protein
MHYIFLNDQTSLNPNLSKLVENLEIEQLNHAIKLKARQSKSFVSKTSNFSDKQKAYFISVIGKIDREADELFTNYQELKAKDKLTLKDNERLKRLTNLKQEYLSIYQFINLLDQQIREFNHQLKSEQNDISNTKKILGLKP